MPHLRLLSWNLWHGLDPYGKVVMRPMETPREHTTRKKKQVELLQKWRASSSDLICVQELNPVRSEAKRIRETLSFRGESALVNAGIKLGPFGIPPFLREGIGIFLGPAFEEPKFTELLLSGNGWEKRLPIGGDLVFQGAERRKALILDCVLQSTRICVMNVHLHHGPETILENRERRSEEIRKIVDDLTQNPRDLIVVCGDFNSDDDSAALHALQVLGFQDSAALAEIPNPLPTWDPPHNPLAALSPNSAPSDEIKHWDSSPHVFDRVLLKSSFKTNVRYEQIREAGLSDHFAVSIEIQW